MPKCLRNCKTEMVLGKVFPSCNFWSRLGFANTGSSDQNRVWTIAFTSSTLNHHDIYYIYIYIYIMIYHSFFIVGKTSIRLISLFFPGFLWYTVYIYIYVQLYTYQYVYYITYIYIYIYFILLILCLFQCVFIDLSLPSLWARQVTKL